MRDPLSRESVLELLQLLIRTPSVNPHLAPEETGTGEEAIAHAVRSWFEQHGVRTWLDEIEPGRCNAIGEVGTGASALVLCGHLDTVATSGMTIPAFDPRVEGDRVYGRGSVDMKGGVASIMAAMAALAQDPLPGRVLAALVADEEYASIGADHFVARYPADACIVTEPTATGLEELVLAHKGFVWFRIRTQGRAAHGSRWDLGESAVAKMGRIIAALDDFDRTVLRKRTHPLVGPASMHPSVVHGGSGWSTYAAECTLQVERRTIPGEHTDGVLEEIRELIAGLGIAAEVELEFARAPMTCSPDAHIARCVRDAVTHVTGTTPRDSGVAYWMDAAVFAERGIPVVDVGAKGAGAHEPIEWIDLNSVVECAHVLVHAARQFFSGADS